MSEQNNEREAFEAAWKERYPAHGRSAFMRSEMVPGGYTNTRVNDAWAMWQARALLDTQDHSEDARAMVARQSAEPVALPETIGTLCVEPDSESTFGYCYDIATNAEGHARLRTLNGAKLYAAAPAPSASPAALTDQAIIDAYTNAREEWESAGGYLPMLLAKHLRAASPAPAQGAQEDALEPVPGDVLPAIGARVQIHLTSVDAWRECTVVGYYVWPSLEGSRWLHRVNVRVRMDDGTLNARMLCDIRAAMSREQSQGGE